MRGATKDEVMGSDVTDPDEGEEEGKPRIILRI